MGSQIHDELELEAVVIWCNHPECVEGSTLGKKSPRAKHAKRFFRSKIDNSGQPGAMPSPGEKMYFGRCEEHASPKVLNYDLVEECSEEEYVAAGVMQS